MALLLALAAPLAQAEDAEARLRQALELADSGQRSEAESLLRGLIAEYPARPEPYNNLAALYAAEGRLEEARTVLEQALHADPAYAAVYDNLSSLNLSIARRAYARALPLDGDARPSLRTVQAMALAVPAEPDPLLVAAAEPQPVVEPVAVTQAASEPEAAVEPQPAVEPVEPQQEEKAVAEAEEVVAPEPAVEAELVVAPEPEIVAEVGPVVEPEPEPEVAAPFEPEMFIDTAAPAEPEPLAEPEAQPLSPEAEVRAALERWAAAWSAQDVEGYLAAYAEAFTPRDGDREEWVASRRQKLSSPQWIRIELDDWAFEPRAGGMRVTLKQRYTSDRYRDYGRKRIDLRRDAEGAWRITAERTIAVLKY